MLKINKMEERKLKILHILIKRFKINLEFLFGMLIIKGSSGGKRYGDCILRSPADTDAFQSGRCAEHNGRPETLAIIN